MTYIETLEDFEKLLKPEEKLVVVVDFTASWCGPCKWIAPKFEEFAKKYTNVTFVKVDVDKATDIVDKYGVKSMPTFMFFKDGKKVGEVLGADVSKLEEELRKLSHEDDQSTKT